MLLIVVIVRILWWIVWVVVVIVGIGIAWIVIYREITVSIGWVVNIRCVVPNTVCRVKISIPTIDRVSIIIHNSISWTPLVVGIVPNWVICVVGVCISWVLRSVIVGREIAVRWSIVDIAWAIVVAVVWWSHVYWYWILLWNGWVQLTFHCQCPVQWAHQTD